MFKKDPLFYLSSQKHSPHNIIPAFIKPHSVILDIGCNTGMIGKKLIEERQATVDGIDINAEALNIAGKKYRKVFQRDLYNPAINIDQIEYDYILFSDILEHLPRPDLVLIDCKK